MNKYKKIRLDRNTTMDEHRIIMENYIGRKLNKDEVVHHEDEDRSNNSIDNLKIMSKSIHSRLHQTGRKMSLETRIKLSQVKSCPNYKIRKFTIDQILEIRNSMLSERRLASKYGVAKTTINDILNHKTYREVA